GIIGDLYYFGMSGFAGADCFISWIVNCTAGISRHRFMYAFQHVKTTFNTPETSTAKYNIFKIIFIHIQIFKLIMRLILFLSVTGNQQKTAYRKKKFPHFNKNVFCSVLFENLKHHSVTDCSSLCTVPAKKFSNSCKVSGLVLMSFTTTPLFSRTILLLTSVVCARSWLEIRKVTCSF